MKIIQWSLCKTVRSAGLEISELEWCHLDPDVGMAAARKVSLDQVHLLCRSPHELGKGRSPKLGLSASLMHVLMS